MPFKQYLFAGGTWWSKKTKGASFQYPNITLQNFLRYFLYTCSSRRNILLLRVGTYEFWQQETVERIRVKENKAQKTLNVAEQYDFSELSMFA